MPQATHEWHGTPTFNLRTFQRATEHRYYDPYIGRFTQRDPARDGINWYVYCGNNPLARIDPTGMFLEDLWGEVKSTFNLDFGRDFFLRGRSYFEQGGVTGYTLGAVNTLNGYAEFALDSAAMYLGANVAAKGLLRLGPQVAYASTKATETGTTVLGKYPEYIKLSEQLGARRFSIPSHIWNKMTPAEQWAANVKFLDRLIVRGDRIVLSNPVRNINDVSGSFRKELDYLIGKGFRLSSNGTQLIK